MIVALVMLAGVVVAKIVTLELMAAHRRRLTRLHELLHVAQSDVRRATQAKTRLEYERKRVERKQHGIRVRIAHAKEQIGLYEFDESCRHAHFDLLTSHKVDR